MQCVHTLTSARLSSASVITRAPNALSSDEMVVGGGAVVIAALIKIVYELQLNVWSVYYNL